VPRSRQRRSHHEPMWRISPGDAGIAPINGRRWTQEPRLGMTSENVRFFGGYRSFATSYASPSTALIR
jgi:hypothetical protein